MVNNNVNEIKAAPNSRRPKKSSCITPVSISYITEPPNHCIRSPYVSECMIRAGVNSDTTIIIEEIKAYTHASFLTSTKNFHLK
jgi:hypothetical protein